MTLIEFYSIIEAIDNRVGISFDDDKLTVYDKTLTDD